MGLFGKSKKDKELEKLRISNKNQKKRIVDLERRHDEKDNFFKEVISENLRLGGKKGSKHMSDRKKYLKGK